MINERIESLLQELISQNFSSSVISEDRYAKLQWPRLIPLMRFRTECCSVNGFGHAAFIRTKALGFVQMLSCSLTPDEGAAVPYLMLEVMEIKGKCTVSLAYYDCTATGTDASVLERISEKYASLQDYPGKPAWYTEKQIKGSMSKIMMDEDPTPLVEMVRDSVGAYLKMAAAAAKDPANLRGLKEFREKMISEGNPLSEAVERVLGKEEATRYYRNAVMPIGTAERKI